MIIHERRNEHDETQIFICPVTHTPPKHPEKAMEIPQATKKRLGLDTDASWIITTEVNRFCLRKESHSSSISRMSFNDSQWLISWNGAAIWKGWLSALFEQGTFDVINV